MVKLDMFLDKEIEVLIKIFVLLLSKIFVVCFFDELLKFL